jgi:putative FmdB family regulatory protein
MPLYDYECGSCGPFRGWRSMSRSDQNAKCPACGKPSQRLVAMPFLTCISQNARIAHERNEKSADQPAVMRREEWRALNGGLGGREDRRAAGPVQGRVKDRPSMLGHAH